MLAVNKNYTRTSQELSSILLIHFNSFEFLQYFTKKLTNIFNWFTRQKFQTGAILGHEFYIRCISYARHFTYT